MYKTKIEQTPLFKGTEEEYLKKSLEGTEQKDICRGWDFLKENLTEELKRILLNEDYLKIVYNNENSKFIINAFNLNLTEELKKQLGSFIYVWKQFKQDLDKKQEEDKIKIELLKRGFIEQEVYSLNEQENENIKKTLKELNGLKVFCFMEISKIGLMGSFDKKEELEGTLKYSEYQKSLMLLPKRSKTKGFIIRKKFYYKGVKK